MEREFYDPFGYASPPRSPEHQFTTGDTANSCGTPPSFSPVNAEGTPKVPLVPFGGRPGRACPPAPRKGRAPSNFYDHVGSGEAPVRRLSFGAGSEGCVSPEPSGDYAVDSMDEDMRTDQEAQQQQARQQHQQWDQQQQGAQQHTPTAGAQPDHLSIPPQPQNQEMLLSPSPPPVQQLFTQQQQPVPESQHRPASIQQQLFAPLPQALSSGGQLRPQQLWPSQQHQLQPQQLFGASLPQQEQTQQQQMWANCMSPAGRPRPPAMQGDTTPARLFR